MNAPKLSLTSAAITFKSLEDGSWTASVDTPIGPMTAVGTSMEDARTALGKLLDAWVGSEQAARPAASRQPT
jgi:predicted RNase H-like HicB family nuclease